MGDSHVPCVGRVCVLAGIECSCPVSSVSRSPREGDPPNLPLTDKRRLRIGH